MDEELQEFFVEPLVAEEIDLDYEFDAAKFYDFTLLETDMEAREAESWFDSAGTYPPSPFVVKLNWQIFMTGKCATAGSKNGQKIFNVGPELMESEGPAKDENILGIDVKSLAKSNLLRSSTLMKPTASHLAKQKQSPGAYTNRVMQRHQKSLSSIEEKDSKNSLTYHSQDIKRQKLDVGFKRKVAQLKHQPLLLHKIPQKARNLVWNTTVRKAKITIPNEPNLATAQRALRRRFTNHEAQIQPSNTRSHVCKTRTLNRKILEAPIMPLPKKSEPHMPKVQVFHLKTLERSTHHVSNDVKNSYTKSISHAENINIKRPNYVNKSKNCALYKKVLSPKDIVDLQNIDREKTIPKQISFETHKPCLEEPPTYLLSKLSLRSEPKHDAQSQCYRPLPVKGLKENRPESIHQVHEVVNAF